MESFDENRWFKTGIDIFKTWISVDNLRGPDQPEESKNTPVLEGTRGSPEGAEKTELNKTTSVPIISDNINTSVHTEDKMAKRGIDSDNWRVKFREEVRDHDYDYYDQRGSYPSRRGSQHSRRRGNKNNRDRSRPASSNSNYRDGRDEYGSNNSTCSEPPLDDRKHSKNSDESFSKDPSKNIGKNTDVPKKTEEKASSNQPNSQNSNKPKTQTQTQTSSKEENKVQSVKPDNLVTPNKDKPGSKTDKPVGNDSSAKSNSQEKILNKDSIAPKPSLPNKDPPPPPTNKSTSQTNPTLPPTGKQEQAYKPLDQKATTPSNQKANIPPAQGRNKPLDQKAIAPSNQEANIPPAHGGNKPLDQKAIAPSNQEANIPPTQGGNKPLNQKAIASSNQEANIPPAQGGNKPLDQKAIAPSNQEANIPPAQGRNIPLDQKAIAPSNQEANIPPAQGRNIPLDQKAIAPSNQEANIPPAQGRNIPQDQKAIAPSNQEANIPPALGRNIPLDQKATPTPSNPYLPQIPISLPDSNKETTNRNTGPQSTTQPLPQSISTLNPMLKGINFSPTQSQNIFQPNTGSNMLNPFQIPNLRTSNRSVFTFQENKDIPGPVINQLSFQSNTSLMKGQKESETLSGVNPITQGNNQEVSPLSQPIDQMSPVQTSRKPPNTPLHIITTPQHPPTNKSTSQTNPTLPPTGKQEQAYKPLDQKATTLSNQEANIPPAQRRNKPLDQKAIAPSNQEANIPPAHGGNKPLDQKAIAPSNQEANIPPAQGGNKPLDQKAIASSNQEANIPPAQGGNKPLDQKAIASSNQEANIPPAHGGNKPLDQKAIAPSNQEANIPPTQGGNKPLNQKAIASSNQEANIPPAQGGNKPLDQKAIAPSNQEANIPPAQGRNIPLDQKAIAPSNQEANIPPAQGRNIPQDQKVIAPSNQEANIPPALGRNIPLDQKATPTPSNPYLPQIPISLPDSNKETTNRNTGPQSTTQPLPQSISTLNPMLKGINFSPTQSQNIFQPNTGSNMLNPFQIPNLRTSNRSVFTFQENKDIPGPVTNQLSFQSNASLMKGQKESETLSGVNPITQGSNQEVSPLSQPIDQMSPVQTSGKPPNTPLHNITTPQHPPTDNTKSIQDITEANNNQSLINTRPSNQLTTPRSGASMSEKDPSQLLEEIKRLDSDLVTQRSKANEAEKKEKSLLSDNKNLKADITRLTKQSEQRKEENTAKDSSKQKVSNELQAEKQKVASLESEKKKTTEELKASKKECEQLKGQVQQYSNDLANTKSDTQSLNKEKHTKLTDIESKSKNIPKELETKQNEFAKLKESENKTGIYAKNQFCPDNANMELFITDIMGQNQFLKCEIEGKNSLIAELERDIKVLQFEFSSISAENQNLVECLSVSRESQKEIFNQTLETYNREIATLRENNLNYETKNSENNRRIQTLDNIIVQRNEKYSQRESELLTEITKLTKSLSAIEHSLRAANDTNLELNSDLKQTQKRNTNFIAELDLLQTTHNKIIIDKNALDLSVAEMREYIDSTTVERDMLIDKQNALSKQSMSLKSENKFLINKVLSLDKQLNELAEIQEQPLSVQHANYFGDLDISHSCLDKYIIQSPSGDQLHANALEHLLHLQKLNWSLQEKIDDLTN